MTQLDSQSTTQLVAKLTSLGYTVTEPKRYTISELYDMKNKQGMYLTAKDNKRYYLDNKLHRTDGPAIEYASGDKEYYHNNKLHRTDGPAIECVNGRKNWYQNGKRHRTDGPAEEWKDVYNIYWLDGRTYLSEQEHAAAVAAIGITDATNASMDNAAEVPITTVATNDDYHVVTTTYRNKVISVINVGI